MKLGWHAAFQSVPHWKPSFALLSALGNTLVRVTMAVGVTVATLLALGTPFAKPKYQQQASVRISCGPCPSQNSMTLLIHCPPGKPGELIRSEEFEQYELPFSVSAVRFLYHSRSAAGEDVAASGVILIPAEGKPPDWGLAGHRVGTRCYRVARPCAPSLMRNVGHGPLLSIYVNLGYAVVVTDYAGLGTNFRNAFFDGPSNATDLIASVSAARSAVPVLGARWIVMGEAEGSLAAVAVAEKESEIRDPSYLGSIAISGVPNAEEIYEHSARASSALMLTSLAYGIKTVFPQLQETDLLTEKRLALYHHMEHMCSQARTIPELSAAEVVKPDWKKNTFVRQYFVRDDLGQSGAYGPILVISGDGDQVSPPTMTAQAVARMCKQGDRVQWERYQDLDSERVVGDSVRDQIAKNSRKVNQCLS